MQNMSETLETIQTPAGWEKLKIVELSPMRRHEPREMRPLRLESLAKHAREGREYPLAYINASYGFYGRLGEPRRFLMLCSLHRLDKEGFTDGCYSYHAMPLSDGWTFTYIIAYNIEEPARYTKTAKYALQKAAVNDLTPLFNYAKSITI